jgi:uncharacterized membrane protein
MTHSSTSYLNQARAIFRKLAVGLTFSTLLGGCLFAQESAESTSPVMYHFENVVFKGDTFVQLLGINKKGLVAGYHGVGGAAHPFRGFVFAPPSTFTLENVPNAAQTQVIGINDSNETAGFFIDQKGINHGFLFDGRRYKQVDFPGTTFNQLLGVNNFSQAAGYYADGNNIDHAYVLDRFGNVFLSLTIPNSQGGSQATGINDGGSICGFYIDSNGVNHGFLLLPGHLKTLDFPGSTFTQALGVDINNNVVGTYNDQAGNSHGFLYNNNTEKYQSIDDPDGVGTTVINGIGDNGKIVGFYVDSDKNTDGFVATPE